MQPLLVIKLHGISYLHFSIEENTQSPFNRDSDESERLNGTGSNIDGVAERAENFMVLNKNKKRNLCRPLFP
jgi:hypothetical protein